MPTISQILSNLGKPGAGFKAILTELVNELKVRGQVAAVDITDLQTKSGADTETVFVADVGLFSYSASQPGAGTYYSASGGGYWLLTLNPGSGGSSPTQLSTPTGIGTSVTASSITVSWSAVTNATAYIVERSSQADYSDAVIVAKTASTSYTDNGRSESTLYYVRVKATASGYTDSAYATDSDTTSAGTGYTYAVNQFDAALQAESITLTSGQKDALDAFVISSQVAGTWHKFTYTLYPYIGGAANAHKYNLKDPRDADTAFRIDWSGTITHSANGVQGNGSTGIGMTHFIPANYDYDDIELMVYNRTNAGGLEMGALDAGGRLTLSAMFGGPSLAANDNNLYTPVATYAGGLVTGKRKINAISVYRVGSSVGSSTTSARQPTGLQVSVLAENRSTPVAYSTKSIAFQSIGIALDDSQESNNNTIIQAYQTALSRNV